MLTQNSIYYRFPILFVQQASVVLLNFFTVLTTTRTDIYYSKQLTYLRQISEGLFLRIFSLIFSVYVFFLE